MSPTDLQEILDFQPFTPMRLTLSSGNVIELLQREGLNVIGLSLSIADATRAGQQRLRFVSVPNIAMLEFMDAPTFPARIRQDEDEDR